MAEVATVGERQVARPLHILVLLIKDDLRQGDEAAEQAGMPYYQAAGEKLLEAKGQVNRGEFQAWIKRNFKVSLDQAQRYMSLARTINDIEKPRARPFSSLRELDRESGRDTRPTGGAVRRDYQPDVDKVITKVDFDTLNIRREELKRAEEREAQRKLALQLIDIGYKVLSKELHPDKGGSREAMARLNQVRDRLRSSA